jgi:hypothetical protein
MESVLRVVRSAIPGRLQWGSAAHLDDPGFYARAGAFLVLASILSGIALRLGGYVGGAYSWFVFSSASDDSWLPMGLAYARVTGQSPGSLHDLFFVDHVKFQYPPSSLLLYSALDLIGIPPTQKALNALVWLSILATSGVVFRLCAVFVERHRQELRFSASDKYLIAGAFAVATLFFYPIMISWRLGQIQGLLNLMFAGACLCWLGDRKLAAGALIGASCLIKPQFSLFLVWALLRREKTFAAGQAAVLAGGLALSLLLYGWANNVYYLEVLSYISGRGEIFWDNSSVNGFVNRILHPDETLIFKYHEFPPFHMATYVLTLASSAIIVAFALFANRSPPAGSSLLDFMTAALSFTLASPIAWGHHYGVVMPILAATFLEIARKTAGRRRRDYLIGWGVCFLLFSNYWNITELLAGTFASPLQSWRLFAAIGLLWMTYRLNATDAGARDGRTALKAHAL